MCHAAALRDAKEADPWGAALFPMYVVAAEAVLSMTEIKPHETLLLDRVVKDFQHCEGNAMFVSHQWAGSQHPDPSFKQFKVLQKALRNMAKAPVVSANIGLELYANTQPHDAGDLSKAIFIWYDYFSIPQADPTSRGLAISSIPSYVRRGIPKVRGSARLSLLCFWGCSRSRVSDPVQAMPILRHLVPTHLSPRAADVAEQGHVEKPRMVQTRTSVQREEVYS